MARRSQSPPALPLPPRAHELPQHSPRSPASTIAGNLSPLTSLPTDLSVRLWEVAVFDVGGVVVFAAVAVAVDDVGESSEAASTACVHAQAACFDTCDIETASLQASIFTPNALTTVHKHRCAAVTGTQTPTHAHTHTHTHAHACTLSLLVETRHTVQPWDKPTPRSYSSTTCTINGAVIMHALSILLSCTSCHLDVVAQRRHAIRATTEYSCSASLTSRFLLAWKTHCNSPKASPPPPLQHSSCGARPCPRRAGDIYGLS